MGGEKAAPRAQKCEEVGSPPHGRGKGLQVGQQVIDVGITPAWAGKSRPACKCESFSQDHPRVGGEKQAHPPATGRPLGSPPHGRGKGGCCSGVHWRHGITPAWAGKRQFYSPLPCLRRDHPRVGGEKPDSNVVQPLGRGSPPRRRGKVGAALRKERLSRITPAWAGKSPKRDTAVAVNGDHPRVGGEKPDSNVVQPLGRGSPPRRRGKVGAALRKERLSRITPAWAGKSPKRDTAVAVNGDHPRVGGEKKGFVCPSS